MQFRNILFFVGGLLGVLIALHLLKEQSFRVFSSLEHLEKTFDEETTNGAFDRDPVPVWN